jgi:hypothetical protein
VVPAGRSSGGRGSDASSRGSGGIVGRGSLQQRGCGRQGVFIAAEALVAAGEVVTSAAISQPSNGWQRRPGWLSSSMLGQYAQT